VTDADTTPIIDAIAVETRRPAHVEEDLSVGPGNVAQPHEVIRKRTRKPATPRTTTTTKKAATARTPRAPRARKSAKATKGE
jgi:hypothetical protein